MLEDITIKIGGEAGSGVAIIGLAIARCLKDAGMHVFSENDYPSLIRGGHNTVSVRGSTQKIHSLCGKVNMLICLNKQTAVLHKDELEKGASVIFESNHQGESVNFAQDEKRKDVNYVPVPLLEFAQKEGNPIFTNSVAVGAALALLEADFEIAKKEMEKAFSRKGAEIVQKNISAAKAGYEFISKNFSKARLSIPIRKKLPSTILLNGNDAICLGALRAGCKFVAEYPMSPSSSVLHFMAAHEREFELVVKHTEDEICAVNMLCGAAFAGARCITATSGGGFSLMAEAIGMAGMAEQPIVIVEVQRAGPSTGLPTYTDQSDLQFALHISHGEFPRLMFCPGDVEECFYGMVDVLNWAEKLQMPAIVLSDKYLGEHLCTTPRFDMKKAKVQRGGRAGDKEMANAKNFKRYSLTKSGISEQCFPGQQNGMHVTSSYEHDETGFSCEEGKMRTAMMQKRAKKLEAMDREIIKPKIYGKKDAEFLIAAWGSTKGPVLEAQKLLEKEGISTKFMHIAWVSPFDSKTVLEELKKSKMHLICEGNSQGQMRALIMEKTGFYIKNALLRYDGRPFEADEIAREIRRLHK
ncbi:hypothetical protein AUJ17_02645 [Candidatus Micrarchaeota archaeon CG1_02_47_40]|nr:MAG: hypothetical protein AUJ17_02645 [Candidatus Micrarchaeota archaeon CG1_02_47_40]